MLNRNMREIVLDTETTGFDPNEGHRVIEIGALELNNHIPTNRSLQLYLNPERDVPVEAQAVHGITTEFLKDKPLFAEKVDEFLDFIKGATLVIHNAEFDIRFLNAELKRIGYRGLSDWSVVDTVLVARKMFPGQPASLDALCRRFKIDNTERTFHGALLDSQLLAEVYLELCGGRQQGLGLLDVSSDEISIEVQANRAARQPRHFKLSDEDHAAHQRLIEAIGDAAMWKRYNGGNSSS